MCVAIDGSVGPSVHCSVYSPVDRGCGAQSCWSGGGPVGGEDGTLGGCLVGGPDVSSKGPLCVP